MLEGSSCEAEESAASARKLLTDPVSSSHGLWEKVNATQSLFHEWRLDIEVATSRGHTLQPMNITRSQVDPAHLPT
jgi:hypothetical protein